MSLLSHVSEVLARLMYNRVKSKIEENLGEEQFRVLTREDELKLQSYHSGLSWRKSWERD